MQRLRAGVLVALAFAAVFMMAAPARAQECVVGGTPVAGEVCPSPSPSPSPTRTRSPSPSPSPSPTRTRTATATPTRTASSTPQPTATPSSAVAVPPSAPMPTPSNGIDWGNVGEPGQGRGGYEALEGFALTRPGLPIAPSDGRGLTAMIVGMLGAAGAGTYALARARVRAWMIGI